MKGLIKKGLLKNIGTESNPKWIIEYKSNVLLSKDGYTDRYDLYFPHYKFASSEEVEFTCNYTTNVAYLTLTEKPYNDYLEFVSYDIAKKLKKIGFDAACFAHRECGVDSEIFLNKHRFPITNKTLVRNDIDTLAPTWQGVFKWFREYHDIIAWVAPIVDMDLGSNMTKPKLIDNTWSYFVFYSDGAYIADKCNFNTFESAQEACILDTIKIISSIIN